MYKKKRSGRKRATMLNACSMICYQTLTILFGFVIPRLLLTTYGPDLHGYTSTVSTIMNYVALLNLGLSTAAIQSLYQPLAEHDERRLSKILNAINHFYIKTGAMYTAAVLLCASVLPFVISAEISGFDIVALMLVSGATGTLECFIYSKHRVLLQADQKLFIVNLVDLSALVLRGIFQIALMVTQCSIILVQGIPLLLVLLRMLALSSYVRRHYPDLDPDYPPDYSALSKRRSVFAHQVAGLISTNTDVILLGTFGTMKAVSVFSVYNLVFSHLYTLITNIFSYGVLASFGEVISQGKHEVLRRAYEKYELVYYMFVTVIYSASAVLILPFVRLYTNGVQGVEYVDFRLAALFVAVGIVNNLRVPCNTMITASGHFKETAWRAMLEAGINLTVSLLLFPRLGVYGLLMGTIASFLYRTTDTIRYSNKYILHRTYKTSVLRLLRVVLILAFHIFFFSVVFPLQIDSWAAWLACAALVTACSGISTLLINTLCEYRMMKETLRYLFGFLAKSKTHQS